MQMPYTCVEVGPLFKTELKWSEKYKKVSPRHYHLQRPNMCQSGLDSLHMTPSRLRSPSNSLHCHHGAATATG